jgi:hypothetical protein
VRNLADFLRPFKMSLLIFKQLIGFPSQDTVLARECQIPSNVLMQALSVILINVAKDNCRYMYFILVESEHDSTCQLRLKSTDFKQLHRIKQFISFLVYIIRRNNTVFTFASVFKIPVCHLQ